MLFASLRGNIIVYQGEELGLTQVDIPFEQLQDPEAIANWQLTLSRDGARTPMPWHAEVALGGFNTGQPWLPLGEEHLSRAVDRQESETGSLLNLTAQLLHLRRDNPALRLGDFTVLHADDQVLAVRRSAGQQTIVGVFNLSAATVPWPDALVTGGRMIACVNQAGIGDLPPYAGLWIEE